MSYNDQEGILMDYRKRMEKMTSNMTTPQRSGFSGLSSSTQKNVAPVTNKPSEIDKEVKS